MKRNGSLSLTVKFISRIGTPSKDISDWELLLDLIYLLTTIIPWFSSTLSSTADYQAGFWVKINDATRDATVQSVDGWFFKTNLDAFMHFNNQQYL